MREESSAEHRVKRSDNILIPPVISKAADDNKIEYDICISTISVYTIVKGPWILGALG